MTKTSFHTAYVYTNMNIFMKLHIYKAGV